MSKLIDVQNKAARPQTPGRRQTRIDGHVFERCVKPAALALGLLAVVGSGEGAGRHQRIRASRAWAAVVKCSADDHVPPDSGFGLVLAAFWSGVVACGASGGEAMEMKGHTALSSGFGWFAWVDLRRRAVGQVLLERRALLLEGRLRLFPTRHHEGRRRVSVQEAEGAPHGRRSRRDDLRNRAAAGGVRSHDSAVRALRRDIESPGARHGRRAGLFGEVPSRRLAGPFGGFDGSRKVYWDQTKSNDLRCLESIASPPRSPPPPPAAVAPLPRDAPQVQAELVREPFQHELLVRRYQRHDLAPPPQPSGPAASVDVHVPLVVGREVEVDHVSHAGDVEAARGEVRGQEYPDPAVASVPSAASSSAADVAADVPPRALAEPVPSPGPRNPSIAADRADAASSSLRTETTASRPRSFASVREDVETPALVAEYQYLLRPVFAAAVSAGPAELPPHPPLESPDLRPLVAANHVDVLERRRHELAGADVDPHRLPQRPPVPHALPHEVVVLGYRRRREYRLPVLVPEAALRPGRRRLDASVVAAPPVPRHGDLVHPPPLPLHARADHVDLLVRRAKVPRQQLVERPRRPARGPARRARPPAPEARVDLVDDHGLDRADPHASPGDHPRQLVGRPDDDVRRLGPRPPPLPDVRRPLQEGHDHHLPAPRGGLAVANAIVLLEHCAGAQPPRDADDLQAELPRRHDDEGLHRGPRRVDPAEDREEVREGLAAAGLRVDDRVGRAVVLFCFGPAAAAGEEQVERPALQEGRADVAQTGGPLDQPRREARPAAVPAVLLPA
ncbi:hypothetical protein THAOC_36510, partial [Thalassiosira oceanica]